MPHFVAAYAALPGRAVRPATEEMLTRSPPPERSRSRKTSVVVMAPSRFTSTIFLASSRWSPPNGPSSITPALLTRTSTLPNSRSTTSAAATIEARSVTSATIGNARPPSSPASVSMRSERRASNATRYPLPTNARAVASPIPEDAPVMTATPALPPSPSALIDDSPQGCCRVDPAGPAGVEREVSGDLGQFFLCQAVVQRAAEMGCELVGACERGQSCHGDEAAVALRQTRP